MGLVTERLMEGRALTNTSLDQVTVILAAEGEEVRLDRDQEFVGRLRELSQNGLTSDDHELWGPVIPEAARTMCSSWYRCTVVADLAFGLPDPLGREDPRKR